MVGDERAVPLRRLVGVGRRVRRGPQWQACTRRGTTGCDFTTLYGLLVQHLWSVGAATGDAGWTSRGDDLLLGAQRAHEEFASFMTEVMSGHLPAEVRREYPLYARPADRARELVGPTGDDYAADAPRA